MTQAKTANPTTSEHEVLVETLRNARHFLRYTVRDLTDEQAAAAPTASELSLGGLIKHVAATERAWTSFILEGPSALGNFDEIDFEQRANEFRMLPADSLSDILAAYDEVARRTDELVAGLPSLDLAHPLPEAPWFQPGARWSARRVLMHIIAETAQHSGHADIIRESIDGSKTMG